MIRLITYTSGNMDTSAANCVTSALKNGVDEARRYNPGHISDEFKRFNAAIWNNERGAGLWLWKPYICMDAIRDMPDNSYLVYSDAGITFIDSIRHIINRIDEDIFFFTNTFRQVEWTRRSVMDTILPEWTDGRYNDRMQVQASVITFRVSKASREFIKRWYLYCQMPELIEPKEKDDTEFPTYSAHREDQSILCALQIKYGYKLHWYPSTTGYHVKDRTPDDKYPALFNHHRKRDPGKGGGQPEW